MQIACPYCKTKRRVKEAKPGTYQPECVHCAQRFVVIVGKDSPQDLIVRPLSAIGYSHPSGPEAERSPDPHRSTPSDQQSIVADYESSHTPTFPATDSNDKLSRSEQPAVEAEKTFPADYEIPNPPTAPQNQIEKTITADYESPAAPDLIQPISPSHPHDGASDAAATAVPTQQRDPQNAPDDQQQGTATSQPQKISTDSRPTRATWATATVEHKSSFDGADPTRPDESHAQDDSVDFSLVSGSSKVSGLDPPGMLKRLGGYKIVHEIGRGAMGTVYQATQLSLDRTVALKTIQAQWCDNPRFVARFTREAYAAAQLIHHNVVQVYDLDEDQGINFFSMEFVRGESLAKLLEREGQLQPKRAVGFILQAARGLQFVHNHGMVHRDVKPANLLLNELGVVKVADLGLVKTPQLLEEEDVSFDEAASRSKLADASASVTLANASMGTPAYMAPEQSQDAAHVDHRADIYSLGCTLYVLLAGRPPFADASAVEVITKHRSQPMPPLDTVVKEIPAELSGIVERMVAKQPAERYEDLGAVIEVLESFLSKLDKGNARHTPAEDQDSAQLNRWVAAYNTAPAAKTRGFASWAFTSTCTLAAFASLPLLGLSVASGMLLMLLAAILSYFTISGLQDRTYLFGKCRALLLTAHWTEKATGMVGSLLLLFIFYFLGLLGIWLAMMIVGGIAGAALYLVVDRELRDQRRVSLENIQATLKNLRSNGMAEGAVHEFICQSSGQHWEELFEDLFGYEAKIKTRQVMLQKDGLRRPQFRTWRDGLIRQINARLQADLEKKNRDYLQKVEQQSLEATGISVREAQSKAEFRAQAMIDAAVATRISATQPSDKSFDPQAAAAEKRAQQKSMLAEAKSEANTQRHALRVFTWPVAFALGSGVRFLLGCFLIAGCTMWMSQTSNDLQPANLLREFLSEDPTQPLNLPIIHDLAAKYFHNFNSGLAGIVLVASALAFGWRISFFVIPAAALMIVGESLGIPAWIEFQRFHLGSLVAGSILTVLGMLFGRHPLN